MGLIMRMGILENKFDPARLSIVAAPAPKQQPSPHVARRRREYLPVVDWGWFKQLAALPGKTGWVALALYRLATMRKSTKLMVNACELAAELGINRKSVSGGMKVLEQEGIIRLQGGRGSFATVELLVEW